VEKADGALGAAVLTLSWDIPKPYGEREHEKIARIHVNMESKGELL